MNEDKLFYRAYYALDSQPSTQHTLTLEQSGRIAFA